VISLPTDLTLNNCQAEVKLAERILSKRQKMLLRQPVNQKVGAAKIDAPISKGIELTAEEEKAMTHPYLYGSTLDRI
jgi:hypothetical protein